VLHGSDLTYSIVGDVRDTRFEGGIIETYRMISQGFISFFQKLGLSPQIQPHSPRRKTSKSHVCFMTPSAYEILIDQKKIIGSAQRQKSKAFLQHGTIPIYNQIPILEKIFLKSTRESLQNELTSLESTGVLTQYSLHEIIQILLDSFQETFELSWTKHTWTPIEQNAIQKQLSHFQPKSFF